MPTPKFSSTPKMKLATIAMMVRFERQARCRTASRASCRGWSWCRARAASNRRDRDDQLDHPDAAPSRPAARRASRPSRSARMQPTSRTGSTITPSRIRKMKALQHRRQRVRPTSMVCGIRRSGTSLRNLNQAVVGANEPIPSVSKKLVTAPSSIASSARLGALGGSRRGAARRSKAGSPVSSGIKKRDQHGCPPQAMDDAASCR